MALWILQISDLHFGQVGTPLPPKAAFAALLTAVRPEVERVSAPIAVVICGDVVDRGAAESYRTAAATLENELLRPLSTSNVICCPGNHDVVPDDHGRFQEFNRFSFRLSNRSELTFTPLSSVATVHLHGYEFVVANSMYRGHEDRHRGAIKIEHLQAATADAPRVPRILVTHHNFIPNDASDSSTLTNAYEVLQLAVGRSFIAVLHGHLHAQNVLTVSRFGTSLIGVGSLLYKPWANYNNAFILLRLDGERVAEAMSFRYIADATLGGKLGVFQRTTLEFV